MDDRVFERTALWQRTLAPKEDRFETQRTRLRSSYESMRRNAAILCSKIQTDLPGLTLHDVNHLDALWSVADLITGSEYPLNPSEAYIFGVAVLLHDSAHTLFVYQNGLKELRTTPEWRDAVVSVLEANGIVGLKESDIDKPSDIYLSDILFLVLRNLHAKKAEELAFFKVPSVGGKTDVFLLEDNELRNSYGALAGLIAASHHWPVEQITTKLQKRVGAISGLPTEWHIDPVKIACLLRCADAGQIDMRRAPDFLFSILKLRGLSAVHWKAQNKLAQPMIDPDDSTALLFTSTGPYTQPDADAWWVAWDLVQIVDNELQKANALLKNTGRPGFQVTRVRDADSVERFATHVTTVGWHPILADVTATDPIKLATYLGGKELYGPEPLVPLRELIQNAADAIRARRKIDRSPGLYHARVTVSVRKERDQDADERYWLDVRDNGVGMSERILATTLLDFGSSLWTSQIVEEEFPGLRGSLFRSSGRFGIGFYSVFMIADRVEVTSRRYDQGLEKTRTLLFREGLKQRPIIVQSSPSVLTTNYTTCVSLRISQQHEEAVKKSLFEDEPDYDVSWEPVRVSLSQRVAALAPTLDCDVFVEDPNGKEVLAHSEGWFEEDGEAWLRKITLADALNSQKLNSSLSEAAPRLSLMYLNGKVVGRAAISRFAEDWYDSNFPTPLQPGIVTHGGLSARPWYHKKSAPFVGAVEMVPLSANRYLDAVSGEGFYRDILAVDQESYQTWMEEQEQQLDTTGQTADQLLGAFIHFAQLGHLSPKIILLRKHHANADPKDLSDVKLTTLAGELFGMNPDGGELVFAAAESGSIVPLVYHNSDEFSAMNSILADMDIANVFFPVVEVEQVNRFDLSNGVDKQGPFLTAIAETISQAGFAFTFKMEQVPHRKSPIEFVDAMLKLVLTKQK